MSFSANIKNECAHVETKNSCCHIAELAGIFLMAGNVGLTDQEKILRIHTENATVARRIFFLVKNVFGVGSELQVKNAKTKKGAHQYSLRLEKIEDLRELLKPLKLFEDKILRFRLHDDLILKECCKKSALRGFFLGGGSMSDPESAYHVEFVTHHQRLNEDIQDLLAQFDLLAKKIIRKGNCVIYIKDSDQIVDLLRIIGAHHAMMELENIRILKEMRNNVNRIVNCETANLEKTVNAAYEQVECIKIIEAKMGFSKLPKSLQEIARLRVEFPEATLKELGEMLSPPLGKSGVNHRLRKLMLIAQKF